MTSLWVGERVRLRAREPEDWEAFLAFEEDSDAVRSGWRRRSHYANGRYHDEVLFGMTMEEYTGRHG
ncbi:hypothetical protein [Nonomuraea sp. NPDC050643]|uniref:hypothetical protein n=1 Tax=Nonomuraea sp. NPDC050643 TaxID=3155660 RepID=UPI0033E21429